MRFLYLCFDILDRRFFLIEPTVFLLYVINYSKFNLSDYFVQRQLDYAFGTDSF